MTTNRVRDSLANANKYYPLRVWGMVISSSLGMFQYGYILTILNTLMRYFELDVYYFTCQQREIYSAVLNSAVPIGAGIGALVTGSIAKKIGRRKSMILIDLVVVIASIFTLIRDIRMLLIGRFIGGFCVGANSVLVSLYLNEIAPLSIKGVAGAFSQVQICLGSLFAVASGLGLPKNDFTGFQSHWWRVMLGFPILIGIIRFLLLLFVFTKDTPKYLTRSHQQEKAVEALALIYKQEHVTTELALLEQAIEEEENAGKVTYRKLFGRRFRKRLFIGCFVTFLMQMTGINAFIFYSTDIFKHGRTDEAAITLSILFSCFNLLATLVSGRVIKKFGRKTILIWGDVGITIMLITTAVLFLKDAYNVLIIPIIIFIVLFRLSYGPVPWIYAAEILPDIGVGIAVLFNWIGVFIMGFFFPILNNKDVLGPGPLFGIFGAFNGLSLLIVISCVKETRGLTPAQINRLFVKQKPLPKDVENLESSLEETLVLQDLYEKLSESE